MLKYESKRINLTSFIPFFLDIFELIISVIKEYFEMRLLLLFLFPFTVCSQILNSKIERITLPSVDNEVLQAQELERRAKGVVPEFALPFQVNINAQKQGTWSLENEQTAIWQMLIYSPKAYSLNLGFSQLALPEKATLFIHSTKTKDRLGAFTNADLNNNTAFWTPIILGDEILVEVRLPAEAKRDLVLEIEYVNHDFMGFGYYMAQDCYVDAVCGTIDGFPELDALRDVIKSVAVYSINGARICTGFLVNNTRQDCTPYFMTANHCGVNERNASSVVVYWNFENSTCRKINTPENERRGNGKLETINSGAKVVMEHSSSDITLLRLNTPVVEAANAFFSGWVNTLSTPSPSFCVHHPSGGEKRVSISNTPTFIGDLSPSEFPGLIRNPIIVPRWDVGSTQDGSSGAPLFNENSFAVGVVNGGLASCANNDFDAFGPIALAWEGGGAPSSRLKDWLDPDNLGISQLKGLKRNSCGRIESVTKRVLAVCEDDAAIYEIMLSQVLSQSASIKATGLPADVRFRFSSRKIQGKEILNVELSNLAALANSDFFWELQIKEGEATLPVLLKLTVFSKTSRLVQLLQPLNKKEATEDAPHFIWEKQLEGTTYDFQLAQDVNFSHIIKEISNITQNSVKDIKLSSDATYYWRVRANTICSQSNWSAPFEFTTAICNTFLPKDLPINISSSKPQDYESIVEVNLLAKVVEVNIMDLRGEHDWISDMQFALESPSGTIVQLIDRPCFDERGFHLTLDDKANTKDFPCPPTNAKAYQPLQPLSKFKDELTQGVWKLRFRDNESDDGGVLKNWELRLCYTEKTTSTIAIEQTAFELYPNPSAGTFNVLLRDNFLPENIQIFDWSGKLVYTGIYQSVLHVEHLTSGIYVVELINAKNAYSKVISIVK